MQNIRPSILQRSVRPHSRAGQETTDDAYNKEEKRMAARRARVANYETQFRISHTYDATTEEKKERVDGLQNAHDMLMHCREKKSESQRELDHKFAENQARVTAQDVAQEEARNRVKKQAEIEAGKLNRDIAESRRIQKVEDKRNENARDNNIISQNLAQKRTFLY